MSAFSGVSGISGISVVTDTWRRSLAGLRRERGQSAVIVLTLALALAGVAIQATVVDRRFVRPLPEVANAAELDRVRAASEARPERRTSLTWLDWQDLRAELGEVYAAAAASSSFEGSLVVGGEPRRVSVGAVDDEWFGVLGVSMRLGVAIHPGNSGEPVAVLSHAFWRSALGGREEALGETFRLNGHSFTVVGVAPPQFRGTAVLGGPDLWIPLESFAETAAGAMTRFQGQRDRKQPWLDVVARRAPGVDTAGAATRLDVVARQLDRLPEHGDGYRLSAEPLVRTLLGPGTAFDRWLGLYGVVVLLVLLAACSNVAGLLAGRTLRRHRELGIRLALGETRGRLVASLLGEAIALAFAGGALALALLWLVGRVAGDLEVRGVPLVPSLAAAGATTAIAGICALVSGLVPALAAARPGPVLLLGGDRPLARRLGAREGLVAVQVAVCFLVLAGAALAGRTLQELRRTPLGFEPRHAIAASVDVAERGWGPDEVRGFYDEVRSRLERSPAIERVGLAAGLPMAGSEMAISLSVELLDQPAPAEGEAGAAESSAMHALVDAGLLATLEIPVVAGRSFGPADTAAAPLVAVVNEAAARAFWPGASAVGRRVRVLQTEEPVEIVGVVASARLHQLEGEPEPLLLLCHAQAGRTFLGGILQPATTVVARAAGSNGGSSQAAVAAVRAVVRELAPEIPLYDVTTLDARLAKLVQVERQATVLFGISSGVALALALLGLFAVAAQSVVERTRELGLRTACGATPRDLGLLVLRRSAASALVGVALGIAAASPLGRLVEGQLRGAGAAAPATWVLVGALLLLLTCAVTSVPARRAARLDPVRALRRE